MKDHNNINKIFVQAAIKKLILFGQVGYIIFYLQGFVLIAVMN